MEAYKKILIVGMLLAIAMLANGESSSFCRVTKEGLKACQACLSGEKNAADPPTTACCSAIAKADLQCLCRYSGLLTFYGVDPNQAMELPVRCKLMDSFHC